MKYLTFILLIISKPLLAVTYTTPDFIHNMTVGRDFARVQMNTMQSAESCSSSQWYLLRFEVPTDQAMYSMLLAARSAKQKVHFQLIGCDTNYPKIRHVYSCDTSSCQTP